MRVYINDPEELIVGIHCSGPYNPDTLDDMKARVLALYRDAFLLRKESGMYVFAEVEEEHVGD